MEEIYRGNEVLEAESYADILKLHDALIAYSKTYNKKNSWQCIKIQSISPPYLEPILIKEKFSKDRWESVKKNVPERMIKGDHLMFTRANFELLACDDDPSNINYLKRHNRNYFIDSFSESSGFFANHPAIKARIVTPLSEYENEQKDREAALHSLMLDEFTDPEREYSEAEIAAKITELKIESQEVIKHNLTTWK